MSHLFHRVIPLLLHPRCTDQLTVQRHVHFVPDLFIFLLEAPSFGTNVRRSSNGQNLHCFVHTLVSFFPKIVCQPVIRKVDIYDDVETCERLLGSKYLPKNGQTSCVMN